VYCLDFNSIRPRVESVFMPTDNPTWLAIGVVLSATGVQHIFNNTLYIFLLNNASHGARFIVLNGLVFLLLYW